MTISQREEKIFISNTIIENAKRSAVLVEDRNLRKKVFTSFVAINTFIRYMELKNIKIDIHNSLSRIHSIVETIDLNNLSFNGLQFDLRILINGDKVFIPKSHFRYEIKPDIYVAARLDKNLSQVKFLGFVETDKLHSVTELKEHYVFPVSLLTPMSMLEGVVRNYKIEKKYFEEEAHKEIQRMFLKYFDNQLTKTENIFLLRHLFYCPLCRTSFINFYDFDILAKQIRKNPYLLNNCNFDFIGDTNSKSKPKIFDNDSDLTPYSISEIEILENLLEENVEEEEFEIIDEETLVSEEAITTNNEIVELEELSQNDKTELVELSNNKKTDDNVEEATQQGENVLNITNNNSDSLNVGGNIQINNTYEEEPNKIEKENVVVELLSADATENKQENSSETNINILFDNENTDNPNKKEEVSDEKINAVKSKLATESKLYSAINDNKGLVISIVLVTMIIVTILFAGILLHIKMAKPKVENLVPANVQKVLSEDSQELIDEDDNLLYFEDTPQNDIPANMVNNFANLNSMLTITKISWEVNNEYAENMVFRNYLQNMGTNIQTSLQKELVKASDYIAANDNMQVSFTLHKNQTISNFKILNSSGSAELDRIIGNNIQSTIKYYVFPDLGNKITTLDLKLTIGF